MGRKRNQKFLEAGGGKKTNESSSKIVEAGGGNKIRPNEATQQFETKKNQLLEEE